MSQEIQDKQAADYDLAKDATRRAVFLNMTRREDSGDVHREGLAHVFRECRERAIAAGQATGLTADQVDAEISQLCDEDVVRLRQVTDEEFTAFARESGEMVTRFLMPSA